MPKIITNFGIDKLQILLTRCIYLFVSYNSHDFRKHH